MDKETLNTIIVPVLLAVSGFIIAWLQAKTKQINTDNKNEKLAKYINMAEGIITSSVLSITQTYVDAAKKNGLWDATSRKTAFEMACVNVRNLMTKEMQNVLSEAYADLNGWIKTKIEENVKLNASLNTAAPTPSTIGYTKE